MKIGGVQADVVIDTYEEKLYGRFIWKMQVIHQSFFKHADQKLQHKDHSNGGSRAPRGSY